jgi:chemotaxis protein MotA
VHAVEEVMDNAIKTHHHEVAEPQHALQNLADALPALGIVAAVLGVVKTMGSIDKPPEHPGRDDRLGAGRHLPRRAAGLWSGRPVRGRAKQIIDADAAIYHTVKQIIIASLHGHPQPLVIEAARSGVAHHNQPASPRCSTECAVADGCTPAANLVRPRSSSRRSSRKAMAVIMAAPGRSLMPTS